MFYYVREFLNTIGIDLMPLFNKGNGSIINYATKFLFPFLDSFFSYLLHRTYCSCHLEKENDNSVWTRMRLKRIYIYFVELSQRFIKMI